jgi:hypothetical protein
MKPEEQTELTKKAIAALAQRCPRLFELCYWAGTACIAIEELHHRQSFDLDFHTRHAFQDVRPILAEIERAFPGDFHLIQAPDGNGAAFQGALCLPGGEQITIEVLSNYEDVPADDLVESKTVRGVMRVSLARYLADKVQCVAERVEARDLVDILTLLRQVPAMEKRALRILANQDAVILAERLLCWSDEELILDLEAYDDVNPDDAIECRDRLLGWLKEAPPLEGDE